MFMTTTLAHYQLPVTQVAPVAPTGEAAGSGRSVLDRPVAVMTPKTELPATQIVSKPEKTTLPFEFRQWLERLQGYEKGAEQANAAKSASEAVAEVRAAAADQAKEPAADAEDAPEAKAEAEAEPAPVKAEAKPAEPPQKETPAQDA